MEVKLKFNEIDVKEEKEKTLVKVLMLKGEKGDTVSAEWGTITGSINRQTDLKNALDGKANNSDIPTKTSDLNNDSGFITNSVNNLTNYYTKNDTDNKLKKKVYYFDTVALMKASIDLAEGDMVITKGYYSANDGGAGEYEIVNDNTLTEDGGLVHEISNVLFAKLIVNDKLNIKQFGAKGDGTTDDTLYIQKALDTIYNIFIPNGTYKITDTLIMPFNKKIYGESRKTTIINSVAVEKYIIQYGTSYNYNDYDGFISEITFKSTNSLSQKPYGIYIYSGITIKNCNFNAISKAIYRDSHYIDLITLENIYFSYCVPNGDYIVKLDGNADALKLDQIKVAPYLSDTTDYNGIYISASHGCSITNSIINCELKIVQCNAFSISNTHFENEGKSIYIEDSTVECSNCFKFKNKKNQKNDIILNSTNYYLTNSVKLNNFVFYTTGNNYTEAFNEEISTSDNNDILLQNAYRQINSADIPSAGTTNLTAGVKILNNENFNLLSGFYSKNCFLKNNEIISSNFKQNNVGIAGLGSIGRNKATKWKASSEANVHYRALVICDEERKVICGRSNDLSISNIEQDDDCVSIAINNNRYNRDILLYSGSTLNEYTKKTLINSVNQIRLIDNGIFINGCEWETIEATNGYSSYNNVDYYEKNGNNVIIYADTLPTKGTWAKYDKVINTNIVSGNVISWIYDGTTWVSTGIYA